MLWDGQRLFITDSGHNRVLIWTTFPAQNGAPADRVIGQPDFVTAGGEGASPHRFSVPSGLAVVDNALFVTDSSNRRVLVFDPVPGLSVTNVSTATQVLGQPDTLTTEAWSTSSTSLNAPGSISAVGDDLFVAESGTHRVLRFDLALPP